MNIKELRYAFGKNDKSHEYLCTNDPLYDCAMKANYIVLLKNYAQKNSTLHSTCNRSKQHIVLKNDITR